MAFPHGNIAQVVNAITGLALTGGYYPGDAFEVETLVCQAGAGKRPRSPFQSQVAQDAVILPQAIVHCAHQVVAIPVQAIVVGVSAGVRTEFLVGSTPVFGPAFQTTSFQKWVYSICIPYLPSRPGRPSREKRALRSRFCSGSSTTRKAEVKSALSRPV